MEKLVLIFVKHGGNLENGKSNKNRRIYFTMFFQIHACCEVYFVFFEVSCSLKSKMKVFFRDSNWLP